MSNAIIPRDIKVISFDLDDTLWNGTQVIMHAEKTMLQWMQTNTPRVLEVFPKEALRDKKMQFIRDNPHLRNKISAARQHFLEHIFAELDYSVPHKKAQACFEAFYEARQQVVLFDDVLGTLDQLKQAYRLIAITNGNADIEKTGLAHAFEFCLQAENFERPKPHQDIFHHALALTDCHAEEVLHVGDHPVHDMQGAFEVGMHTCWLNDGKRQWDQNFEPDFVIESISGLAQNIFKP